MKTSKTTYEQIMKHEKWLRKHNAHPDQIKKLPKPKWEYDLGLSEATRTYRHGILQIANCTKSPNRSLDRIGCTTGKYVIAPVCNKGAYGVISKDDLTTMGKKV